MAQVGSGKYTYEHLKDFPTLPADKSFGNVSRVATDSQDRLYVFQRKQDPPMMIFDRNGNYLNCWGSGAITDAHGMTIIEDIVYTTDRSDSVAVIFTLDGKPLQVLGKRGVHSDTGYNRKKPHLIPHAAGPFNYPTELVPSPWGELYATDGYGNARVHRFTREGQLISSWGEPGQGPGQFHLPHSLVITPDRKLYVCDRANLRVQIFTAEGELIGMWTGMGQPNDIFRDKGGIFYLCEQEPDGRPAYVSIRDESGKVLARWESRHCHGVCVDSHGDIYVGMPIDRAVDKYVRQ